MSDIFQEVDEALQKDKMLQIWDEYKNTIIAAIAILILSAGSTSAYHGWNNSRNEAETAKLLSALESRNPEQSLSALMQDTRKNQVAIAAFAAASIAIEEGNKEKAATLYAVVVEKRSTPRDLRDLARILYIKNAENPEFNVLKPLLSNKKSPWIWHARVEAAAFAASDKKYDDAVVYLEDFQDVTTIPLSLKQRGMALHHVYSQKAKAQESENETTSKGAS